MSENCISDNFAPNWLPYFTPDIEIEGQVIPVAVQYIHYYPTLFTTPEGNVLPDVIFKVDCQICGKLLAISDREDNEKYEIFTVLPCGHAFGLEDIKEWLLYGSSPTCPSCRAPLWHQNCEHYISLTPLEFGMNNMRTAISKCIREISPQCCQNGNAPNDGPSDDHGGDVPPRAEAPNPFQGEEEPVTLFMANDGTARQFELRSSRSVYGLLQRAQLLTGVQVTYHLVAPPPLQLPRRSARHYANAGQQPPLTLQRRNATVSGMETAPDFGPRGQERGRSRRDNQDDNEIDELTERMARRVGIFLFAVTLSILFTTLVLVSLVSIILLILGDPDKMPERQDRRE
ncbi:hypothetical protein RRF57_007026 [Xylaria bambusicola]|uniref:RING-type domain-containing protein n=1 Tax=Xylaria bambusicola TaxID=326684 RepID=A0AAN7Z789_9PEZI